MMQKPQDPYQEAGSFWIILGLPTQEKHNNSSVIAYWLCRKMHVTHVRNHLIKMKTAKNMAISMMWKLKNMSI